ncbi:cyclic peptide export ABC transporter [uncultured Kordia sp.]|uniref:cyclic peptide export ABC transporter n=1 Tax=uncultured Kordia sp. TaxID=507699 RepID=UPI002630214B|nr:cyclic peptide export ABC transporter [uncultured Kordia sp.]
MEFLKILLNRSKAFYAALVLISVINGLLNIALLMFINSAITKTPIPFFPEYDWLVFSSIVIVSFLAAKLFQTFLIKLSTKITFDFEMMVLRKVKNASFQDFEELGKEKVFTAMGDIRALGNLPEVIMNAINSLIIITCCFIYLFMTSVIGGGCVLFVMAMLLVIYIWRNTRIERKLEHLRSLQNSYFRYLNDLLLGFKELKMSLTRNHNIHTKFLEVNRSKARNLREQTSISYLNNELTGNYSWYIIIGAILFALPRVIDLDFAATSAFLVTILYMIGPIAVLITLIPTNTRVKIALGRLSKFNKTLSGNVAANMELEAHTEAANFSKVTFEEVSYEYFDKKKEKAFELGPLNLQVTSGEVLFIVGANGSGKSTFVNLLTGLYKPKSGNIKFYNDKMEPDESEATFKKHVATIFTHPYLFSENYDGFEITEENKRLTDLIAKMKLTDVVRYDEEKNTIDNRLSKGQEKRLAMVYTLLEDKPIIVLDEWAAEQDPEFRAFFYSVLIPELKQKGKTIIAISHDDKYFSYADRIIKFDYGKIEHVKEYLKQPREVKPIQQ